MEITSGIAEGVDVVVDGKHRLADGVKIKVVQ